MENEINELLQAMKKINGNYSIDGFLIEKDYLVQDALVKLYFLLLANEDNSNYNMYYNQFIRAYRKLDNNQKDIFKKDFNTIMRKQKEMNERSQIEGKLIGDKN